MPCYWHSIAPPATLDLSPDGYLGGSAINNSGYVLTIRTRRRKRMHWVCLWRKDAGVRWLFPIEISARPIFFNDVNQVLYSEVHSSLLQRLSRKYFGPRTNYCLWDPKRGKIVLNDQIPQEIGRLVHINDINNRGCIMAVISLKDSGKQAGVLLEPIPQRWGK